MVFFVLFILTSKLVSLFDGNGDFISNPAIKMGLISLTYLDTNTCLGIVPVKNPIFDRNQMVVLTGLNNDYNIPKCTVTAQIVSATQINIYARSTNVNAFTKDTVIYVSYVVIGATQ